MRKKILLTLVSSAVLILVALGITASAKTSQDNMVVMSKEDVVLIENAITDLRKRLTESEKEAEGWHQDYTDLANCIMEQAKEQKPALECLGDTTI